MEALSEPEDRYGLNYIKSADIPLLLEQWRFGCTLREVGELHTLRIGRSGLSAGSPVPRPMRMCGLSRFQACLQHQIQHGPLLCVRRRTGRFSTSGSRSDLQHAAALAPVLLAVWPQHPASCVGPIRSS